MPGEIDDDMAILVVRSSATDLDVEERTFSAQPIMVSEARRMAAEAFAGWNVPEERAELACLLVSEVVTNVVLHAASASVPRRELVVDGGMLGGFEDSWDVPGFDEEIIAEKEFTLRLRRGGSPSGSRSSTRTCACPASAARARTTRAAAASTWSTSSPGAGAPAPPRRARPSGSRSPPSPADLSPASPGS
nr:hypothetical protein GCM10020093_086820 [Planobispora longispora]